MADIPQEVREAAKRVFIEVQKAYNTALALEQDGDPIEAGLKAAATILVQHDRAMFLAGRRAGMERAAEIAEQRAITQRALGKPEDWPEQGWNARQVGIVNALEHIAQAIRSENDGHG